LHEVECSVKVGGHMIETVRFVDDKAVVAGSDKGLQELMDNNNNRVTQKCGMKINLKKTKVVCIARHGGRKVKILIDGQKAEQVNHFKYLGSVISEDGYCEKDVRCRISMAKSAFVEKKKLLTGKFNIYLKKRIVKSGMWSVALYAAETWTLTETLRKKLEAFASWVWRRMLKISWTEQKS